MRSCGECTLCCTVTAVPELNKPERTTCRHCAVGCTIYEERPTSCRTFFCAWAKEEVRGILNPRTTHVMVESWPGIDTVLVLCEPGFDDAWEDPVVKAMISDYLKRGIGVVINAGATKRMVIPNGRSQESLVLDMTTAQQRMEATGDSTSLHY